jgi:predicted ArsR family transcriptional regulator
MESAAEPRKPTATVVRRVLEGREELVIVCERCDSIKVIEIADAMRIAMNAFMREHDEDLHR